MSAIEDTRKVLQDFLAPELRAISARLDALETRVTGFEASADKRLDAVDKRFERLETRIADLESRLDAKLQAFEGRIERRADERHDVMMLAIRNLMDYSSLQQRLTRLEALEAAQKHAPAA